METGYSEDKLIGWRIILKVFLRKSVGGCCVESLVSLKVCIFSIA
jgi:hypothetical protein